MSAFTACRQNSDSKPSAFEVIIGNAQASWFGWAFDNSYADFFHAEEEGCRQAAEALGYWAIFKAGSLSHLHEYPVFLADYPRWHETNLGKCSYSWSAAAELKSPHPNLQTKLGLQRMWKLFLSRPSQRFSNILWQPHTYYMLWKSSLSFIAFKHLNFYVSFLGP